MRPIDALGRWLAPIAAAAALAALLTACGGAAGTSGRAGSTPTPVKASKPEAASGSGWCPAWTAWAKAELPLRLAMANHRSVDASTAATARQDLEALDTNAPLEIKSDVQAYVAYTEKFDDAIVAVSQDLPKPPDGWSDVLNHMSSYNQDHDCVVQLALPSPSPPTS